MGRYPTYVPCPSEDEQKYKSTSTKSKDYGYTVLSLSRLVVIPSFLGRRDNPNEEWCG